MKNGQSEQGSTLLEVIIAVTILGVVGVSFLNGLVNQAAIEKSSNQSQDSSQNLNLAAQTVLAVPYRFCIAGETNPYSASLTSAGFPSSVSVGVEVLDATGVWVNCSSQAVTFPGVGSSGVLDANTSFTQRRQRIALTETRNGLTRTTYVSKTDPGSQASNFKTAGSVACSAGMAFGSTIDLSLSSIATGGGTYANESGLVYFITPPGLPSGFSSQLLSRTNLRISAPASGTSTTIAFGIGSYDPILRKYGNSGKFYISVYDPVNFTTTLNGSTITSLTAVPDKPLTINLAGSGGGGVYTFGLTSPAGGPTFNLTQATVPSSSATFNWTSTTTLGAGGTSRTVQVPISATYSCWTAVSRNLPVTFRQAIEPSFLSSGSYSTTVSCATYKTSPCNVNLTKKKVFSGVTEGTGSNSWYISKYVLQAYDSTNALKNTTTNNVTDPTNVTMPTTYTVQLCTSLGSGCTPLTSANYIFGSDDAFLQFSTVASAANRICGTAGYRYVLTLTLTDYYYGSGYPQTTTLPVINVPSSSCV